MHKRAGVAENAAFGKELPCADILEASEARENYMLWCSGTREKTLLAFLIWKPITILGTVSGGRSPVPDVPKWA